MKEKTKSFPVKLRVISKRVPKDYPTIYDLCKEDYNKLSAPRIHADLREIRAKLQQIVSYNPLYKGRRCLDNT